MNKVLANNYSVNLKAIHTPNPLPFRNINIAKMMAKRSLEVRLEKQRWAQENLRQNFMDEPTWRELAKEYGMRLPAWYFPASETKLIKRALKNIGMNMEQFTRLLGFSSYQQFCNRNPDYPAYAVIGLLLEFKRDGIDGQPFHKTSNETDC